MQCVTILLAYLDIVFGAQIDLYKLGLESRPNTKKDFPLQLCQKLRMRTPISKLALYKFVGCLVLKRNDILL